MTRIFIFMFSLRLLQDNPELFQLYKDLVVSQVISAEEFWATQAAVSRNFLQIYASFLHFQY